MYRLQTPNILGEKIENKSVVALALASIAN
jgi:hypothetical protein